MTAFISPPPRLQFFSNAGVPMAGGLLYTYAAGTTTPLVTYTDSTGLVANTNPVILDSRGEASIWLGGVGYKFKLATPANVDIWTQDNIAPGSSAYMSYTPAGTGAVTTTVQAKLRESVSVKDFGAVGDGTTDDTAAIQAALSSGSRSVYLPPARYRCASGIAIPANVHLFSTACVPGNDGAQGTGLVFDLAVATCVTLGGASVSNTGGGIKGFSVVRAAGAIPAASIGILNQNTYGTIIEDIGVFRHSIGIEFRGDRASAGIAAMVNRVFTGTVSDTHVLIDTYPEVRFNQCRFGQNGAFDLTCNSFIKIVGGSATNAANGPNGLVAVNCQFNQGQNLVATWLSFALQQAASISDISVWQFDTCYIETCSAGITTDASWTNLNKVQITNTNFNMTSGVPFLALNVATSLDSWAFSNNIVSGSFSMSPTAQMNFINVSNNRFVGLVSVTGVSNTTCIFSDNTYSNGLTIAGAFAANAGQFSGVITSGSLTDTSASNRAIINISSFNGLTNWTPTINFGGASVGVTYSVRQATYQIIGQKVFGNVVITLTSKGTSAGAVTITGLPIAADNSTAGVSGGGIVSYLLNVALLTSPLMFSVSGSTITLYVSGAAGVTGITDANITATTDLRGSFVYTRA